MRKKAPLLHFLKYISFFLLLLFSSIGNAQEKDTVLFIPKIKYQSKLLITKTDSINLLKRKAVLTAKSSKELTERMAELDAILNSYKKESERITKIIKADSIKVAKNNRKRINIDSLKAVQKSKETKDELRLARLNAIIKRNDSIKLVKAKKAADRIRQRKQDSTRIAQNKIKLRLRNDSIRTAKAQIAAKNKEDSLRISQRLQKEKFRQDSIRVVQAKILSERIAQRKQDSINTVIAQQRAQFKADSTRVAQAKIIADQIAQRKLDSTNTAIALQQRAQFKADSTRVAQAKIIADQIVQRKLDSTNTAIALQQQAQFKADSTRVAQAKIIADQIAQRKLDSTNTAIALQQQVQFKADSTRVAQAKIIADQIAQRKLDSTNTAIALHQQVQFKADSTRVAQAKIIADQIAQRKLDSTNTAIALQQQALLRADSIRIAQNKVLENQIAKRKQDSITNAIAIQKVQLRTDSIRIARQKNINDQLDAKRKQDSINTAIALQQKTQFKADSTRVAKLIADEIAKRKQDSIINVVAKTKLDEIFNNQDSTAIANNDAVNTNRNLELNNDFEKTERFIDSMPYIRTGNLLTKFVRGEIELKDGQIVSNVLKVVNIGRQPITFTTDLLIPAAWTRIDDENKKFIAKQNDTVIVPIIISPTKLVNGNTEIIINSFILGSEQQQLANNYFSLKTKKKVSWKIELSDSQNMYLKNEEKQKRFNFQVHNSGNYRQDLFVNYTMPRKDLYLSDTLGKIIKQPNTTFTLEGGQRKKFDYIVSFKDMNKRNFRRVSQDSYNPNTVENKKTHSLIINSNEPRLSKKGLQKRTKVNFVKLPNEIKANPYGYPYFPLTIRLSAQNILNDRSFLSLNLRGFKQFNETSNLVYSTDISYSNSYYTNDIFKNAPWYVGYFDDKKTIEIGQISGNLTGISSSGKGIKGSYKFNDQHHVGAYYTNSGGFAASKSIISFGAWHKYFYNEDISIKSQIGRSVNSISDRSINVISFQPSIRLQKKHNLSFTSSFTNKSQKNEPAYFKANGLLVGGSYTSHFLNKKLRFNFSTRYNDRNFSFGNFDRLFFNQRTTYTINDKWNVFLSNNYQQSSNFNVFTGDANYSQKTFFNNLVFNTKRKSGNYQPGIFYEYRNYPNSILYNRGLTFRFSSYNYNENLVSSLYLKAGYTKPALNNAKNKDYFNFELSSLTRFRTWNFNAKYNLGAFSTLTSQQTLNDFITPQSIRVSAQNQYLFPSRKVLVESSAIYSYNNVFSNHTFGVYPTIYYFNKSGWRFGMSANYTFSTSDFSTVFDNLDNQGGNEFNGLNQTKSSNFNLNFSLKKDFGIPIPFVDRTAATGNFVAFLDLNGNGIKENDETTLENVVIQVGKKEVLTNIDGEAVIKNLLKNEYDFNAFSLENLNGWFPNVEATIIIENDDTKYVPFVRGIKVYGDVVLDRQKIAVADSDPTDLSRIKISATRGEKIYSSLTNNAGRFEFYLPFGDYIITMDEAILNNRLRVTRNNIPLQLKNTQDGVYVSFYIIEKRRKVIFTDFTKKKN
mgnify:CR=1 FL=1